ncbi:MAG: pyruvate kinase [Deinococcota bacterium]|jgi:pyruvate kinase|nr:pyruvate kinase [Deinococcota bacterium]
MQRRTRIVATIGPATSTPEMIVRLMEAGVNVFRLNFSHGSKEVHRSNIGLIREHAKRLGQPVGVLQDLQGPKIRVGRFEEGKAELEAGQRFDLTCDDDSPGNSERVGVTYKNLYADVKLDDNLLLDDGRLGLKVTAITGETIRTEVTLGGILSNNKGINLPAAKLSIPALTDKDVEDLIYGAELNVDWVAMSFVRSRDDLLLARHYLARAGSRAKLMAKIEKPGAVERFEEILSEVDGVMVARGDLGVEMPPERVPLVQKRLIRASVEAGKPVVTATQMLESMIHNPTPTRAEASDVANAIYDGTDAVMLSAETAIGSYPVEAVRMMGRIALSVESDPEYQRNMRDSYPKPENTIADSVSLASCQMAYTLNAKVIVSFTSSGVTALRVSRNRPAVPILAITPNERAFRQMSVAWGVFPMLGHEIHNTDEMVEVANRCIHESGIAALGDRYVITAGVPFGVRGTTNLIRVERVRS